MESWFISDIHLKDMKERNGEILLRFLHSLADKDPAQTQLFMLGDIFDLWVAGHQVFVKKFQAMVDAIRVLREKGMKVTYIEGNHDVHVDHFWQKQLGVEVFVEAQYRQINGVTLRLEHGDLINLEDTVYLRYRALLRAPWLEPLGHIVPGRFWDELGNYAARKSRGRKKDYHIVNEERLKNMIRTHAQRVYREKPFDVIISGHMHVFDDYQFQEGERPVRSINLGSWYGEVRALKMSDQEFSWVSLEN